MVTSVNPAEVSDLRFSYQKNEKQTDLVNIEKFCIRENETTVLTGPSGCGKSTFLYLLAGLLRPDSGSVRICGIEFTKMTESEKDLLRASSIGFIFQNFNLLQGFTALENVLAGTCFSEKKSTVKEASELLERVGLRHRKNHFPAALSSGEQQRVAIARAVIKKPALILADEPTGALDPENAADIIRLLLALCADSHCALLAVTHQPEIAKDFSRKISFQEMNSLSGEKR